MINSQTSFVEEEGIFNLVQSCHSHYHMYMSKKIRLCKEDLSFVIAGMWRSPFEASFLWIGGWRPTTAIVLAYSLMGMQIEGKLQKLLQGIELPSMATLSQKLCESEDSLSNRLAILQMLFADLQMAKDAAANPPPSESKDFSDIREAMEPKLASLRDIFAEAEQLRGETIHDLLRILRPIQARQYALAAYEMTMVVQKLGDKREGKAHNIRELASQGNVDLLTKALQSGVDPSETHHDGRTPLGTMPIDSATDHVCGIPEHVTNLALRPTCGPEITSEPYRLFNLNVFEYIEDSPFGLHGSIPFMLSQRRWEGDDSNKK
ncbi:hypothetical protein KP509_29G023800 [Ceratopteris richardii]|uniref:DOG1 domain-containing protein n=1 Tax=Ceratopteris richardii TaxID=49495 RepID=A0A8T2R725_CERRI|nr:hypothetical protein KP509_29G023800 [Ceratopteris richardii]